MTLVQRSLGQWILLPRASREVLRRVWTKRSDWTVDVVACIVDRKVATDKKTALRAQEAMRSISTILI